MFIDRPGLHHRLPGQLRNGVVPTKTLLPEAPVTTLQIKSSVSRAVRCSRGKLILVSRGEWSGARTPFASRLLLGTITRPSLFCNSTNSPGLWAFAWSSRAVWSTGEASLGVRTTALAWPLIATAPPLGISALAVG